MLYQLILMSFSWLCIAIVNKETAALKHCIVCDVCALRFFSFPALSVNGSVLFLLTGSYNHQAMGNLSKLSIMSLEFFALFSVGCLRCNSASCTVILSLCFLEKNALLFKHFDPLNFVKGEVLKRSDFLCRPEWSRASGWIWKRHKDMNVNNSHKSL